MRHKEHREAELFRVQEFSMLWHGTKSFKISNLCGSQAVHLNNLTRSVLCGLLVEVFIPFARSWTPHLDPFSIYYMSRRFGVNLWASVLLISIFANYVLVRLTIRLTLALLASFTFICNTAETRAFKREQLLDICYAELTPFRIVEQDQPYRCDIYIQKDDCDWQLSESLRLCVHSDQAIHWSRKLASHVLFCLC